MASKPKYISKALDKTRNPRITLNFIKDKKYPDNSLFDGRC